jgi:hypothetical protein
MLILAGNDRQIIPSRLILTTKVKVYLWILRYYEQYPKFVTMSCILYSLLLYISQSGLLFVLFHYIYPLFPIL